MGSSAGDFCKVVKVVTTSSPPSATPTKLPKSLPSPTTRLMSIPEFEGKLEKLVNPASPEKTTTLVKGLPTVEERVSFCPHVHTFFQATVSVAFPPPPPFSSTFYYSFSFFFFFILYFHLSILLLLLLLFLFFLLPFLFLVFLLFSLSPLRFFLLLIFFSSSYSPSHLFFPVFIFCFFPPLFSFPPLSFPLFFL